MIIVKLATLVLVLASLLILTLKIVSFVRVRKTLSDKDRYGELLETICPQFSSVAVVIAMLVLGGVFLAVSLRNGAKWLYDPEMMLVAIGCLFAAVCAGGGLFSRIYICENAVIVFASFKAKIIYCDEIERIDTTERFCTIIPHYGKPTSLKVVAFRCLSEKLRAAV